jgi:hypothetical protein
MANDTSAQILELGVEWARAEQEGNTEVLDQISAAGFRLVGPFGFHARQEPNSSIATSPGIWSQPH